MNINTNIIYYTIKGSFIKESNNNQKMSNLLSDTYKESIRSVSYLGPKGWTIPKSAIRPTDLAELKRVLAIKKAISPGAPPGAGEDIFVNVFRENDKKLYIPRFFAANKYGGNAAVDKIGPGKTINVEFIGTLRENQVKIVDAYLSHIGDGTGAKNGLISAPCAAGKTVFAINIACQLRKKCLIIVHKEFLMNQWISRIHEFTKRGRLQDGHNNDDENVDNNNVIIGKIQGDKCEIEGSDFVIAMLQTLFTRNYPDGIFQEFGLVIVDECHRICSDQFSKALFKLNVRHTLGISATIKRKDGLESILGMFLGPLIYHEERDGNDSVCVRAIEYQSNNTKFEEVETDARGQVKYSTMIVKLCGYEPRGQFCLRILADLLKEDVTKQIMVLAHNRSLLSYLYQQITNEWKGGKECVQGGVNSATVGFYVGGMKQKDLTETEGKQIVLATYAMAAEALDIKTLSTLVMVTPKTDIIQSVGRILRAKHSNPVVVDIVDTHYTFKNQWSARKKFYKACNYRIRYIKSSIYNGMSIDWNKDTTWKSMNEPIETSEHSNSNNGEEEDGNGDDDDDDDDDDLSKPGKRGCMIDF